MRWGGPGRANQALSPNRKLYDSARRRPAATEKSGVSTSIIEIITSAVRPEIWKVNGGKIGEISQAVNDRVTITAPASVHAILDGPKHYNPNASARCTSIRAGCKRNDRGNNAGLFRRLHPLDFIRPATGHQALKGLLQSAPAASVKARDSESRMVKTDPHPGIGVIERQNRRDIFHHRQMQFLLEQDPLVCEVPRCGGAARAIASSSSTRASLADEAARTLNRLDEADFIRRRIPRHGVPQQQESKRATAQSDGGRRCRRSSGNPGRSPNGPQWSESSAVGGL